MSFAPRISLLLIASLLAACGGGGGGGGGGGASPSTAQSTTPATVSASNYTTVGTEATAASMQAASLATQFGAAADIAVEPQWASWGVAHWRALSAAALQGSHPVGVTSTLTEACVGGGTVTSTLNDLNGNQQIDAGDGVSAVFTNCAESGTVINGNLTILVNTQPTGDLNGTVYGFDITMTFNNLVVTSTSSAFGATANGGLRLVSQRTGTLAGTDTLTASSFTAAANVGNSSHARTLSAFTSTITYGATESVTQTQGVVSSSVLSNQSVTIATITPFRQRYTETRPYAGVATATGANGGKVTLTVIDASNVTFSLDANGDGTSEASANVAWSAIL